MSFASLSPTENLILIKSASFTRNEALTLIEELRSAVEKMPEPDKPGEFFTDQDGDVYITTFVPACPNGRMLYSDPVLWRINADRFKSTYASRFHWENVKCRIFTRVSNPGGGPIQILLDQDCSPER